MVREGKKNNEVNGNPPIVKWLLHAIHKVKGQKQRPNLERIIHAVKQEHCRLSEQTIEDELEAAVKDGSIMKIENRGSVSYRDPKSLPVGKVVKTRTLKINKKSDLTKIIIKAIKEINKEIGASVKNIEKNIKKNYSLELAENVDITHQIRISAKRAVMSGRLVQDAKLFKIGTCAETESVGGSSTTGSMQNDDAQDPTPKVN